MLDTTFIPEVFRQLSQREAGGFVVLRAGRPRHYLKARDLAGVVAARASQKGWASVASETLLDLMQSPQVSLEMVMVAGEYVSPETDTVSVDVAAEAVIPVGELSRQAGWFFTQEVLKRTVATRPPQFVCKNGHKNPDPDKGTCYYCPAPIVGVE